MLRPAALGAALVPLIRDPSSLVKPLASRQYALPMRLARTIVPLLAFVLIACGQSAAPETPSGPWREVGHGAWQDVQWRIFEAGHPPHGRCLAVDLVPPPIVEELPPEGRYRGKHFNCSLTADEVLRRPRLLPTTYDLSRQLRYRWL